MRWTLRGLAWVAFSLAGYLAWSAAGQGQLAGCGGTGAAAIDCDAVFNSPWASWLGLPVALAGLGVYSALAGLSVLLGVTHPVMSRWIGTLFLMLATIAAGAGAWFVALQLGVIGKVCLYCMALHGCGLLIAGLAWTAALRPAGARQPAGAGLAALRSTLKAGRPAGQPSGDGAWQPRWAMAGAGLALALLVGGQVWFPAKTFHVQTVELDEPMGLVGGTTSEQPPDGSPQKEQPANDLPGDELTRNELDDSTADGSHLAGQPHTARRVSPTEEEATSDAARAVDDLFGGVSPTNDAPVAAGDGPVADEAEGPNLDAGPISGEAVRRERLVRFLGGKLTLNAYEYPILGSPEAPQVIVELVSYDCSHCRKMHSVMKEGIRRYGDQLAVIVLPVPLEPLCNPNAVDPTGEHRGACATARLALGVAAQSPRAFATFHDWLMTGEKVPPLSVAMEKAYSLVDRDRLRAYVRSDEANERVQQCVELFAVLQRQNLATNRNFGLPVQIFGNEVMSGAAEAEDVFRAWEETLGVSR